MIINEKIYGKILLESYLHEINYDVNSEEKKYLSEVKSKDLTEFLRLDEISIKSLIKQLGLIGALTASGTAMNSAQQNIAGVDSGMSNVQQIKSHANSKNVNLKDRGFLGDPANKFSVADSMKSSEINYLVDEINRYEKMGKEALKLKSGLNVNNFISVLNIAEKKAKQFYNVQDNIYLKSLFVTSLFTTNHLAYGSLASSSRVLSVDKNNRNVLFYKYVVGKEPSNIRKLNSEELKECKNYNNGKEWKIQEKLEKTIYKGIKKKEFNLWLNYNLFLEIEKYTGRKPIGGAKDKVSWCGHMIGFLMMNLYESKMAGSGIAKSAFANKRGGKKSSYAYASTLKLIKAINRNVISKKELVYDFRSKEIRNLSDEQRLEAIKKVLFPGSLVTVGGTWSAKTFGTHFVLVLSVDYEKGTYKTIEGNTSGGGGAMRIKTRRMLSKSDFTKKSPRGASRHEIREIINLEIFFGKAPGSKTASKLISKTKKGKNAKKKYRKN